MRKRLNDSEMSLFASVMTEPWFNVTVKDTHGRGNGDASENTYGKQIRKCRYTVVTRMFGGLGMARSFRVMLNGAFSGKFHSAAVEVLTDNSRRGLGFMDVRLNHKDGSVITFNLSQSDARNLAQMLNAASNSCDSTWRKSSVNI
jgi:hypothetical protein